LSLVVHVDILSIRIALEGSRTAQKNCAHRAGGVRCNSHASFWVRSII
jgi:hypothetical protein